MDILSILENGLAGGVAALGFGLMFNSHKRIVISIFLLGMLGIILKSLMLSFNFHIVFASFVGATAIGILGQLVAYLKKTPVLVVSIPPIIPMIPGKFIYTMMIGIIKLDTKLANDQFVEMLRETISNGLTAVFIILVLSLGISLPYLVMRKQSVNYFKGTIIK